MYTDQDETKEVQENRIEYFKKKGEQQLTKEGRTAEITVDLMLQARAKMSNNKVNGLEDAIVSEWIKHLPLGTICTTTKVFSGTLHGSDGISKFVEDRETSLLEETGC